MRQNSSSSRLLRQLSGSCSTETATNNSLSILRGRVKKFVELGILFFLLIVVIVAIFTPVGVVIEEFLNIEGGGAGFNYEDSCSIDNVSIKDTNITDLYQDHCYEYGNGICGQHVELYARNLSTLHHEVISEDNLTRLIDAINIYASQKCRQIAIPFVCQYVYPPCLNDTSYQLITGEQCLYVKDKVCKTEWPAAESYSPGLLPNCEIFINQTLEDNPGVQQNDSNETFCIDQFDTYCDKLCVPSCKHFSQYDEATTSYRKAIDVIASIIGLIGGTLFIIIAVRRRENLLQFPAILVFYMTLCPMIFALFLLITRIDDGRVLYCTHEVLTDTLSDPSLYCQLSGAVFHILIILMGIFWFLHLSHVYLSIKFPIQLNFLKRKKWSRGLHITEVTGAVILSAIGPMVVFISGNEYNIATIPPIMCFPASTHLSIYTMSMPLVMMFTIGVCIIIIMLWTLIKKNALFRRCFILSTPEIKILILTIYFIALSVVLTTRISLSIEYFNDYYDHLYFYFYCQLQGDDSACSELKKEYEQFHYPHLNSVIILMIGLTTCVNLIFAIKAQDVKDFCSRITRGVEGTLFKTKSTSTNDVV